MDVLGYFRVKKISEKLLILRKGGGGGGGGGAPIEIFVTELNGSAFCTRCFRNNVFHFAEG